MQFPNVTAFQSSNSHSRCRVSHVFLFCPLYCRTFPQVAEQPSLSFWDFLFFFPQWQTYGSPVMTFFSPHCTQLIHSSPVFLLIPISMDLPNNYSAFSMSSKISRPVLHPSFPHVYSKESCPCKACNDRQLSDQDYWATTGIH